MYICPNLYNVEHGDDSGHIPWSKVLDALKNMKSKNTGKLKAVMWDFGHWDLGLSKYVLKGKGCNTEYVQECWEGVVAWDNSFCTEIKQWLNDI